MKYNAEVDSEKRNKSPRNDLLRNRKCVGIIQAAKTHTGTLAYLQWRQSSSDVPRCQNHCGDGSGLNKPNGAVGLRHQATRKSVRFRGRLGTVESSPGCSVNLDIQIPFPQECFHFYPMVGPIRKRLTAIMQLKVAWCLQWKLIVWLTVRRWWSGGRSCACLSAYQPNEWSFPTAKWAIPKVGVE